MYVGVLHFHPDEGVQESKKETNGKPKMAYCGRKKAKKQKTTKTKARRETYNTKKTTCSK